jgi:hypothetical protein
MSKVLQLTAGASAPLLRIDVGDDGWFEFTEFTPNWTVPATLSPVPLRIRVQLSAAVVAPAEIVAELQFTVRPDNQTSTSFAIGGCSPLPYSVAPTFAGDLRIAVDATPATPAVAVFGLGWQPTILGQNGALPCILLPMVHHLLLSTDGSPLILHIPVSARPITLWTQAVLIGTPFQLTTTAGFVVSAL